MEEISCPLCGKPNPADNKFCDFCLAHLEPVEGGIAAAEDTFSPGIEDNREGLGWHESDADTPDWLSEIQQSGTPESDEAQDQGLGMAQPDGKPSFGVPATSGKESINLTESSTVSPFLGDQEHDGSEEIPPWLNEALIEEDSSDRQQTEEPVDVPLDKDAQEEVPNGSADETVEERTPGSLESAGPLAGLTGVLAAEPGVARIRKPRAYSTKLKVSESQEAHVELLQTLLEDEGQAKSLPRKSAISQQHVLRWSIALVLLIAVLWSIITAGDQMPFPIYDEGSAEVNRLINQLPENARVLVGFDYEPGLAAELDTAAAPVFDHLMGQGALLTLISTSPNGPILAERFMQSSPQPEQEYINGLEYINLGYIPGGAAGLLSFIENPQGTTPYSIEKLAVWETETGEALPALVGINQITDYSMILLLVDDPDVARIWIEQLTPSITNPQALISLVLITSAQLEPVVRPYFESIPQSVNGLVVGLRGGAAYARLTGGDQQPSLYWNAFGMGVFVAALLILVGGLAYYVVPELSRTVRGQNKVD